ncbi:MAG: glutamine amidotransferase [Hydrogenophilales bacterium 28-61-23]|nr:MAG: glutamine amidotransferase [Hydrogenophilales bacterium 28-61-23]
MKPIAIFRHAPSEGPGHFASFLDSRSVPWQLIAIDAGADIPSSPENYAGLAFMGGPMSVNDDLPWIEPTLNLIRQALAADIPVLGHCLGGQLIAKAMGGVIGPNPVKEIGWGAVQVLDTPTARHWFGDIHNFQAFHWHGETFSIPPGAECVLKSAHCGHQAYVFGKHLGLQCHVEMNRAMIEQWSEVGADEINAARNSPAVQNAAQMLSQADNLLPPLNRIAEILYARWLEGIAV